MIIDAHTHVFETADGYQETYRLKSHRFGKVWMDDAPELDNLPGVLEYRKKYLKSVDQDKKWGTEGGRRWVQWLHPEVADTNWKPEVQIAYMDLVGIDRCVLLQAPCYHWPDMNEYLSYVLKRHPGRFAASAQIDAAGGTDQIDKLVHAVTQLGLTVLKLEMSDHCGLPLLERKEPFHLDDPKRDDLWRTCVQLNIPVVLDIDFYGEPPPQAKEIRNVFERFPELVFVWAHNARWGIDKPEVVKLPLEYNIYIEIDFANAWETSIKDGAYDPNANVTVFRSLYDSIGADRLLWGTDVPWALAHSTYKQLLGYIKDCPFLTEEEKAKIMGENAHRVYFKHEK